jgi:ATP-binding cassette subfamily F protein 3
MTVLSISGLGKSHGATEILRGVELNVARGDKLGCVGRNGAGKTTLLRLVEGEEHADHGTIQLERDARIGYVVQRPGVRAGPERARLRRAGPGRDPRHRARARAPLARDGDARGAELDSLTKRHGDVTAHMEHLGGWEAERRSRTVLSGIGLDRVVLGALRRARCRAARRAARASRACLSACRTCSCSTSPRTTSICVGIEWLEDFLRHLKSAVLIVSHDRRLLDRLVDSIVEIERARLTRYPGNYAQYLALKAERYKADQARLRGAAGVHQKEELFIRTHMGSQRTGEAKGRQKKLENVERLPQPFLDVRRPVIRIARSRAAARPWSRPRARARARRRTSCCAAWT